FSAGGIEGVKKTIVGAAADDETAGGRQHRPPVLRLRIGVCPHPFTGVDLPRLHFADVVGAGSDGKGGRGAGVAAAGRVWDLLPDRGPAEILVGWNIDHPRLRTERDRRAVFSAPERRAVMRQ